MPVQDEQRVVDAHREAEHQTQGRRDGHHVHERRGGHGQQHAHSDAEQRVEQRKADADERAQHDEQHDGGHHEADDFDDAHQVRFLDREFLTGEELHAVDVGFGERVGEFVETFGGDAVEFAVEPQGDDGGVSVVGDQCSVLDEFQHRLGALQLRAAFGVFTLGLFQVLLGGLELGEGLVELFLALFEPGCGGLVGAVVAGLLDGLVEVFLCAFDLFPRGFGLLSCGVDLRSGGVEFLACGVDLVVSGGDVGLGGERVGDRGDGFVVFESLHQLPESAFLFCGERSLVRGSHHHVGAAAGEFGVGELPIDAVRHLQCLQLRQGDFTGELPAEAGDGREREQQEGEP